MRSSLSCESCRRSKVRCVHSGSPPCKRCARFKAETCSLSLPQTPSKKRRGGDANKRHEGNAVSQNATQPSHSASLSSATAAFTVADPTSVELRGNTAPIETSDHDGVGRHMLCIPKSVIVKSLNVFTNQIPELSILHIPTLLDKLQRPWPLETKALLSAVLAVTKSQLSVLDASWADCLLDRELYASYSRHLLSHLMLQPPRIQIVQALLIITLYEWGSRNFHKAWVYCGIAIRIMQAVHSHRVAAYPLDLPSERRHDATSVAIETRTYWSCFVMDCMVNAGTYNPPMLPMSEMKKLGIARPLGAVEFALGPDHLPSAEESRDSSQNPRANSLDMTRGFEALVGGFDIWTQLMTFIFNDGRRAPGMCAAKNCPWVEESPWSLSMNQLRKWRASQHQKLHYPSNSVAAHNSVGYGETFVYLNLLYYVSALMLHRDYFPFLPTTDSIPEGPVDHPLLEAEAPPGWWEDSANELSESADRIAVLLHEASESGVCLMTPFAGFCAFSAGYINLYMYRFPRMNLGRSPEAQDKLQMCLEYLHKFKRVWPIADGWIKTIAHASLLYEKAVTNRKRYEGRSRADFEKLHQSVHEFRILDRSDQHNQEIDGVEMYGIRNEPGEATEATSADADSNVLLNQLFAEVSSDLDEQGVWSQWWPPVEDIDLTLGTNSNPQSQLP